MRPFPFFLLIILTIILLSKEKESENKTINKTESKKSEKKTSKKKDKKKKLKKKKEPEQKLIPPPPLSFISDIPDDTYNLLNDGVYLLNDKTIDKVLQNGNNYRWLVILFSETCGHCYFARTEIRKILPDYKYSSYLRFAEIEINFNPMSNMRFNIDGVPYIFMLQNNTMYIMDLYPSQKNIIKFLETDLSYFLPEEKKPFPPMPDLNKHGWDRIKEVLQEITDNTNEFLNNNGIKIQFTPSFLIITFIITIIILFIVEYLCCLKFCPDEQNNEKEENINCKEKDNINENENNNNCEDNEKVSEEEKKIKKERDKEILEKVKKDKKKKESNNDNQGKVANKKKKKE